MFTTKHFVVYIISSSGWCTLKLESGLIVCIVRESECVPVPWWDWETWCARTFTAWCFFFFQCCCNCNGARAKPTNYCCCVGVDTGRGLCHVRRWRIMLWIQLIYFIIRIIPILSDRIWICVMAVRDYKGESGHDTFGRYWSHRYYVSSFLWVYKHFLVHLFHSYVQISNTNEHAFKHPAHHTAYGTVSIVCILSDVYIAFQI